MRIRLRPRLHVGLISMHAGGRRKNGGVGFAVDAPCGTLEIVRSNRFEFEDCRVKPLKHDEIADFSAMVNAAVESRALTCNVRVRLSGRMKSHVGMGAGTGIRLAILESLLRTNGIDATADDLIRLSGRGGTSGIGINTYFTGGIVVDLGIPNDGLGFLPSSRAICKVRPISLHALPMPDWPLCMCIPRFISAKTQEEEIDFFSREAVANATDSYESAYHALFGLYASVVDKQFDTFCEAVNRLQEIGWKKQEWCNYGSPLFELASKLRGLGAKGIGMSSFGPLLYCLAEEEHLNAIFEAQEDLNCEIVRVMPHNSGRELVDEV